MPYGLPLPLLSPVKAAEKGVGTMRKSVLQPKQITALKNNARRYRINAAVRLNLSAICHRFVIQPWVFKDWQRKGWPALDGQRLTPLSASWRDQLLEGTPLRPGQKEDTFRETDLEELFRRRTERSIVSTNPPRWIDEHTYEDEQGERWLTLLGARDKYLKDLSVLSAIYGWIEHGCRFLDNGRAPRHQHVPPDSPRNRDEVMVVAKQDILTIRERCQTERTYRPPRDERGTWLTDTEIRREFRVSAMFCRYWRDKESRIRPSERALRSTDKFRNAVREQTGPVTILRYLREDVERILKGEESASPGSGRPANRKLRRKAGDCEAKKLLKALLRKPRTSTYVYGLAKERGICRSRVRRARTALRVRAVPMGRSGPWLWYLPGKGRPLTKAEKATEFLKKLLTDGPLLSGEVRERAREKGIQHRHLLQAAESLRIIFRPAPARGPKWWCRRGQKPPRLDQDHQDSEAQAALPADRSRDDRNQTLQSQAATVISPAEFPSEVGQTQQPDNPHRRAGRPHDPDTQALHKFCYDQSIVAGKSRRVVMNMANAVFSRVKIREECHVRTYAKRYAELHSLPMDRTK
jgi:hypothetical protein